MLEETANRMQVTFRWTRNKWNHSRYSYKSRELREKNLRTGDQSSLDGCLGTPFSNWVRDQRSYLPIRGMGKGQGFCWTCCNVQSSPLSPTIPLVSVHTHECVYTQIHTYIFQYKCQQSIWVHGIIIPFPLPRYLSICFTSVLIKVPFSYL